MYPNGIQESEGVWFLYIMNQWMSLQQKIREHSEKTNDEKAKKKEKYKAKEKNARDQ